MLDQSLAEFLALGCLESIVIERLLPLSMVK